MKKSILAGLFFAISTFSFAEIPENIKNAFNDKSAQMFDATEYAKYYSDIKLVNKTAEKIEINVYAYDERISKKTSAPEGWIRYGTISAKDYNEVASTRRGLKYLATKMEQFKYFAYTISNTQREVKHDFSYNNENFELRFTYVKPIQPLASLEIKHSVEKNPQNKKEILGIMAEISFRNVSDKLIKRIEMTISAYDKGLISKTKDGKDEVTVLFDELIDDGNKIKRETTSYWNSISIDKIKATKIKIIYNDDSEQEYSL